MKKRYGEITMLDFPDFAKNTFPGAAIMDLFPDLFGDATDDSVHVPVTVEYGGRILVCSATSAL